MNSRIPYFTSNINTVFPVAGQGNDPQGFRDNFYNIKFALTQASIEINTASQRISPIIHTDLVIDPPTKSLTINSATIALSQTSNGTPILNVSGVHDISLNNEKLAASISLGNISSQYPEIGQMALSPTGSYIATGSTGTVSLGTGTWTKLNSGIESNRLIVVKPTVSVNATSPIPNVICDVSMGTRFYIPNPGTDIALNFINLPPSPFEVEVYVTVKLAPNTYSAIRGIFVNSGAIQTTMNDNPGRFVDDSGGNLTYSLDSPGWGFKQKITIMSTEKDQYSVFSTEDIFLSPRSVYSSQSTQDQLTSYVPSTGGYVPPPANTIPGQSPLTINGVSDGGTLNLPTAYSGVAYSYTFIIGGTEFNPNINYAITSEGSVISGLSLAVGKNSATLQGSAGLTLITSNFDIVVSPKYNPTGISCRVHVSLPNANAQIQSTKVIQDTIASSPTPSPTPYTPPNPPVPFVQTPVVDNPTQLVPSPPSPGRDLPAQREAPVVSSPLLVPSPVVSGIKLVTNNTIPDVVPAPTVKPGDPVPGQPGLIYSGFNNRAVDDNGDPYGPYTLGTTTPEAWAARIAAWNAPGGGGSIAAANAAAATEAARQASINSLITPPKVTNVTLSAVNSYGAVTPGVTDSLGNTIGPDSINYDRTGAVKIQATIKTADGKTRIQTLDSTDAGSLATGSGLRIPGLDGTIDFKFSSTGDGNGNTLLENGGNLTYTVNKDTTQPTTNTAPLNSISAPTTVSANDNAGVSVNAGSSYAGATLNLITTAPDNTQITQPVVADSSGNINISGLPTSQPGNVNVTVVADNGNRISSNILVTGPAPGTGGDGGGSGDIGSGEDYSEPNS